MTYDEAVARIKVYCNNRSDINDLVLPMLVERMAMVAVPFKLPEHEFTVTTLSTATETDNLDVRIVQTIDGIDFKLYAVNRVFDLTNNNEMEVIAHEDWTPASSDFAVYSLPHSVSFYGGYLYFDPIPAGVYALQLDGFGIPITSDGDTELPFPFDWHPLLVKYTASDILFLKRNYESALALKNEALGDLSTRVEPRTFYRRQQKGQVHIDRRAKDLTRSGVRRAGRSDYNGW